MAKPTKAEKRAIRRAIFATDRFRTIVDDKISLTTIMGTGPEATNSPPFVLNNGQPNSSISLATTRCRSLAVAYRSIRADIKAAAIQQPAKRQLLLGFAEEAASWDARATLWELTAQGDPDADQQTIQVHVEAAMTAFQSARKFLPTVAEYEAQYGSVPR